MIACLSLYQENYAGLAKLTLDNNRMSYCEAHGYLPVFQEYPNMPDASIPEIHRYLGFEKIKMFINTFEKHPNCEWAWFADCDGMITNMGKSLEILTKTSNSPMLVSSDCHGINCGSMLVKNDYEVKLFLRRLIFEADKYLNEQEAINDSFHFPNLLWLSNISIMPQHIMNSYDYSLYPEAKPVAGFGHLIRDGQWHKGDFFIHWPGRTLEQRIEHYNQYEKEVIR